MITISPVTLDWIEQAVCAEMELDLSVLFTRTRKEEAVAARFLIWRLATVFTPITTERLGARYNRDHSTVSHGCGEADKILDAPHDKYHHIYMKLYTITEAKHEQYDKTIRLNRRWANKNLSKRKAERVLQGKLRYAHSRNH